MQKPQEFNTSEQEFELRTLENEISQAEASLENDFSKYASENIDERLEELFFNDKEKFIKEILTMQNDFLNKGLRAKMERANFLKQDISNKKQMGQIEKGQKEFLQKNPDADIDALMEFYEDELGAKYKKELDKLEPLDFFTTLYEVYKMRNMQNKGESEKEYLPKALNANEADVSNQGVSSDEMPMNRL